ncbi:MAG: Ig-like domain-containing protein [Gemmatimonadales bacterium]
MKRLPWEGVLLAGGLMLGGCGIGDETGPFPYGIVLGGVDSSGDGQMAPAGSTLPMKIRLQALNGGRPVADLVVIWSPDAGSVSPAAGKTNQDGIVETTWTLGPLPGAQTVVATGPDVRGAELVFWARATKDGRSDW